MKRLVKFENGKYGVRVGNRLFGYKWLDIKNPGYRWSMGHEYFKDCQGSLEQVQRVFNPMKYEIIK